MKITTGTVFDILSSLRTYFLGNDIFRNNGHEEPFQSELYSSDQLTRHGSVLARSHKLMEVNTRDQLLKRLDDNETTLLEVRNLLIESYSSGKTITPAAEWLLDNFYIIEEQIVIARRHLPKDYSKGLPYLAQGPSSGLPRVYDIVLEIISHSDGRVDIKSLSSFIASYQTYAVLTLGELWAIPIMLRLAVIENLRRVSGKIALDMIDDNLADYWADKMTTTVKDEPGNLILCIADMARSGPVLDSPFVAAFTRKLQGKGPALALPLTWMEQQLSAAGTSSNDLVRQENQKQAINQVSVRNSIGTLRAIGATDWRDFVEALSRVEQVLRQDITGIYARMNFATRDRYRHVIESIAKSCDLPETEVAGRALELSKKYSGDEKGAERYRHIGYYLIDKGLKDTEQAAGKHYSMRQRMSYASGRVPVSVYLISIILLALVSAAAMFYPAYRYGELSRLVMSITGLLCLVGSTQLAVSVVNWLSTIVVHPTLLPRMDFSKGIPPEYRTLVVVPTLLSGRSDIEELLQGLEIRFLANKEINVHFGLLTDFMDADEEVQPEDDEWLELARDGISALNQKYKPEQQDLFFLFHRPRTWNDREKKWMGYERKRGKLAALNAFLRGRNREAFSLIGGNYPVLSQVKYVITLDTDTQLPRETAKQLIAAMAHPLNHALYDPQKRRVIEGYGILQPRVASAIPETKTTQYLRLQDNPSGIDPYTRVSSDVYQDLFGEGSFIGKGIYDVEIFEQAVLPVFQDNRILSHDLLEGCYARSGLISDVNLYEESPMTYQADIRRHHRWIRGDWQIGAWMLPFVTNGKGHLTKNKLSALSRWKIFDNLRRSLVPLSLLLLLIIGWTLLPFPWFWTLAVTTILLLAAALSVAWHLLHKPVDQTIQAHLGEVGSSVKDILSQFLFRMIVLAYEAVYYTDAIIRTNWRMIVSRKKLLEWSSSATVSRNTRTDAWSIYGMMWISPAVALVCTGLLIYMHDPASYAESPLLVAWLLAPAIIWRLGRPVGEEETLLSGEQYLFLRRSARKTWAFFEEFVTKEDNWLPPDNYQKHPVAVIAHRTSPTNMGLALLANLAAWDFGYIGGGELLLRCDNTLGSMSRLERYKGHFFNWYDTTSMLPLPPRYVSTVDSGNLSGHLLTLRQGFLAFSEQPVFSSRIFEGLYTAADVIHELSTTIHLEAAERLKSLLTDTGEKSVSLSTVIHLLDEVSMIAKLAGDLKVSGNGSTPSGSKDETESSKWINKLSLQVTCILDDLAHLCPWAELLPVPSRFIHLAAADDIPSLLSLRDLPDLLLPAIDVYEQQSNSPEDKIWLSQMRSSLLQGSALAGKRISQSGLLAEQCEHLSNAEYDFLLDKPTGLLSIGYTMEEQIKDASYYDLLASEARLGIFVAIAQGKLPQESWFSLGRLLTFTGGDQVLLSWSGSMFEYLMPQLVMPTYENTLLYQTSKATVRRQIDYASQQRIPWGISESAYNTVDASLNYQYRAFGVPGLGLKRGLKEDLVIAPYASMLALMVAPAKACSNLQVLSAAGFEGEYGFFEAIDYTPSRVPRGKTHAIIHSFMVHHQGMSLLSMAWLLLDKPMQQRFASELRFQATLLLLQERKPRTTLSFSHTPDPTETHSAATDIPVRRITTPHTPIPEIQLLGNDRYQVMITNSGGGYSRWKDIAVTRWREDTIKDDRGIFCYIRDLSSGNFWSNTYQPTLHPAKGYEAIFTQGHVEFRREDYGIQTKTEIVISPEDDTEMRRISITNKSSSTKELEITSYAEVVLAGHVSDEVHPAFSNLFVQTEILRDYRAIFVTRRPRSQEETPPWLFHLMEVRGVIAEAVSYETDRMKFTGRGNTLAHPRIMEQTDLSDSQGPVLDPIVSIRCRITVKPGQTVVADLIYGISETRESCENLMHKYKDPHLKNRAFELSWTHNQVLLRQINATESDAQLYNQLAASVIYTNPALRAESAVILNNFRGQSGLWSHSVSGDLPIVLLHIYDQANLDLVKQMIQAHAYWRLKGLAVDLVIWNEDYGSYRQTLQETILGLITAGAGNNPVYNKPGAIFVKSADQLSPEDRTLFESIARVIIYDNKGSLSEQVNRDYVQKALPTLLEVRQVRAQSPADTTNIVSGLANLAEGLLFFNGYGGFSPDGKEYKIITDRKSTTPAPWVNVIANADFGTVVSESGSAYTWAVNAHEYRLTPWSNDPVSDVGGEAFYLRDEETGHFWSPSPFPAKGATPYLTTHGFGYSKFEHTEEGISSEMTVFVDKALPVKFVVITIKNQSGRERRFSATGYLEIILGDLRSKTNMHILSEQDGSTGALLLRNRYNTPFAGRVSFFKVDGSSHSFTADRQEFLGRNRGPEDPQALRREKLSGRSGAGMDPCAALQIKFELLDNEEKEIIFQIGNGENTEAVLSLIRQFSDQSNVLGSLRDVREYWKEILGTVQINTPDKALNMLGNGWLAYQTIACRLFARSGFYQSGGAFGFRDQLQDVLALLAIRPALAREQLLLSASRQFAEGDVQHWWHPPEGRGVRTRCSDDLLWLPFAVARYVSATGDTAILNEKTGFLESRLLQAEEDSLYDLPVSGNLSGTLYEHCKRAIQHSLQFGAHHLPLIGSGDWNDGMDRVGNKGRGESVWLAFFQYDVLLRFGRVAGGYGDAGFEASCRTSAAALQSAIETSAWDGQWYLRAYFDDGSPLGSKDNEECRIDAIAQSWSVLSGAGDPVRTPIAMASLDKYLVKRDLKLIQLLSPPFNAHQLNPGYIMGYVPGIRENGGQYTHAAVWTLMAFAAMGQREKVWELFSLIQPLNHSSDPKSVAVYKVEPYVMAADVYASVSHEGRGGWTWYTGSAGWMYQFITGSLLGMELRQGRLYFKPCFPLDWPSVNITYRSGRATYDITVFQETSMTDGTWWMMDGKRRDGGIDLADDGLQHSVEVHVAEVRVN
ncbi:MAG TPA: glucoamylase family protein [Puia sp.]|nr:glucoamylase family protein [Puia sp.]